MSSANPQQRSPLLAAYAALVFAFIYLPIAVLLIYSFNRDGVGGFPPRHFTLDWYRQLFSDAAIWDSVVNSLLVAAASVALALTLGLLAALALDRASFPGKALFRRLVLLPLILPGIITGLSLLMFAVFAGMQLSLLTVFLGHGTALISVATTELFAGLQKIDRAQLHSFNREGDVAMSGHDHNREHVAARLQALQQLDAVDAGHADVGNDASKIDGRNRIEELVGGLEQRDMEVRGTEQEIQRIPHRLIVVDDIDLSPMCHASNSQLMRRAM